MSPLPAPVLVEPPNCACKGEAPQMREHTTQWCSVLKMDEINEVYAELDERVEGPPPPPPVADRPVAPPRPPLDREVS